MSSDASTISDAAGNANSNSRVADDDDVEIIGASGANPLVDYPHARFHCGLFPFLVNGAPGDVARTNIEHCPKCYCWVCDVPVDTCCHWAESHYAATPSSSNWKKERTLAMLARRNRFDTPGIATANINQRHQGQTATHHVNVRGMVVPTIQDTTLNDMGIYKPAQNIDPLTLPIKSMQSELVHVIRRSFSPLRKRKKSGVFCICYMNHESSLDPALANKSSSLDSITCTISTNDFKTIAEHSGVSGRGVPYAKSILSDFACIWSCKRCGRCPQVDIVARLNRKRKQERREIMALRMG